MTFASHSGGGPDRWMATANASDGVARDINPVADQRSGTTHNSNPSGHRLDPVADGSNLSTDHSNGATDGWNESADRSNLIADRSNLFAGHSNLVTDRSEEITGDSYRTLCRSNGTSDRLNPASDRSDLVTDRSNLVADAFFTPFLNISQNWTIWERQYVSCHKSRPGRDSTRFYGFPTGSCIVEMTRKGHGFAYRTGRFPQIIFHVSKICADQLDPSDPRSITLSFHKANFHNK